MYMYVYVYKYMTVRVHDIRKDKDPSLRCGVMMGHTEQTF